MKVNSSIQLHLYENCGVGLNCHGDVGFKQADLGDRTAMRVVNGEA